jgi:hypothetical protein
MTALPPFGSTGASRRGRGLRSSGVPPCTNAVNLGNLVLTSSKVS